MKQLLKYSQLASVLIFFILGLSLNVYGELSSLPKADITGRLVTTSTDLSLSPDTDIAQLNYLDGSFTTDNLAADESIVGAFVSIVGATRLSDPIPGDGIYPFDDAQLEVRGGVDNHLYLSATIKNLDVIADPLTISINPNLDANNPVTLNLSFSIADNPANGFFTDGTHPSRFVDEWEQALGTGTAAGMAITGILAGDPAASSSSDIIVGILDGAPAAPEPPPGVRSMGYWKTHEDTRVTFLAEAKVVDDAHGPVFVDTMALETAVTLKGKKTMRQKAEQQLAALLLNIAQGLAESTPLTDSQKQNVIDPAVDTVGKAVDDATAVILNAASTNDDLERVKDLTESINTDE